MYNSKPNIVKEVSICYGSYQRNMVNSSSFALFLRGKINYFPSQSQTTELMVKTESKKEEELTCFHLNQSIF